ncbi:MAG: sugar ABC transporter substrate-binding protein [Sphaerochaetaceae bacterium]
MRRVCSIVLMFVLVVGIVTAAGAKEDSGKMKIFMSSAYYTAPYGAPLQEAVREKSAELGYSVQIVDGEQNADKQLSQFKAAVADGFDALIYWPGDQASSPPIVEYLNSTGLPWVALNTVVADSVLDQVPCMIASDEVEIGRWLGRLMIKYFEENPSPTKNVVYIEGSPGSSYTENLTIGVNEVLEGTDVTILNDHQYAEYDPSKAMAIMEDLLTKYGDRIDLAVAQDGGMFQGAYSAIEAAGYVGKLGLLCQGQDLIVRDKLVAGELFASVAQDPFTEGALAVEMLDKIINGEKVEKWMATPTGPIYAADIDDYRWF